LVIDTLEGLADMFERELIDSYNATAEHSISALNDVPYGRLTSLFNKRIANFSETLWQLPKNVIVLTYTKRRNDDVTGSIVLDSEVKSIRHFTKFADAIMVTTFDGERYQARVASKRTVAAGKVEYGAIEEFLRAAGWELPVRKTKLGTVKK
jgi:hypothetical protein